MEGYPKVVPVKWSWLAKGTERGVLMGPWARSVFISEWGPTYGFKSLNQTPLGGAMSRRLLDRLVKEAPDSERAAISAIVESAWVP